MTSHDKILAKGFVVFLFLLAIGFAITLYTQRPTTPSAKASSGTEVVPSPIPAPKQPSTTSSEVHSSNADKKLLLRATTDINGTTTYTFVISDIRGGNERVLFTKTPGSGTVMDLPVNAWDPTDTYVFMEEKVGGVPNYYVFKANGEPFANGDKFIDIGAVWTAKKIGYAIRQATGWASGTLLIIYTSKDDGSHGPAFWFEIPSTAIIQLAG